RLHERLGVFRESIGDLEPILGAQTEQLLLECFQPTLTDAERDRRAQETAMAVLKQRAEHAQLEEDAVNLLGCSEGLVERMQAGRDQGHWLRAEDLAFVVEDVVGRQYPGTQIPPHATWPAAFWLQLSARAQAHFRDFLTMHHLGGTTHLAHATGPLLC